MASNSVGHIFKFTSFGESHGKAIGCIVDGVPPLIPINEEDIQVYLDRRKPGQSKFVTQRKESDKVEILSGVFKNKTTGHPIALNIKNEDHRSKDYSEISNKFRPSHADITYHEKYKIRDYRGGGRSSARETAVRVAAGAVAFQVLKQRFPKLSVKASVVQIGDLKIDKSNFCREEIDKNPFFCVDKKIISKAINSIIEEPEVGQVYEGKVVKIMEFGAFVNFFGKRDGLVHISQLSEERVEKVTDVVSEGDIVKVKVIGFDKGKVKLSIKDAEI